MMDLRFTGDWNLWVGVALACLLAGAAWTFYRREKFAARPVLRWLLPLLRALAVFLIVMMLTGPVVHHRRVIGQLSRLLLFVDASQSMDLTDRAMDLGRKILIVQRMGFLPSDAVRTGLVDAADALARVAAGKAAPTDDANALQELAQRFAKEIEAAAAAASEGGAAEQGAKLRAELLAPLQAVRARDLSKDDQRRSAAQELTRIAESSGRFEAELRTAFNLYVTNLAAPAESPIASALAKFDALTRWQRTQAILLDGERDSLLAELAGKFDVQLFSLAGEEGKKLWQPGRNSQHSKGNQLPDALPPPIARQTNLADGIRNNSSDQTGEQRAAAVLFSDGRHNRGSSPLEVAKVMGDRGIPLYTVALGAHSLPPDLAIAKVDGPESVFFEDRVRGVINLKDDMPGGKPFTVSVRSEDKVLWEQTLTSENNHARKVSFDFPVAELTKAQLADAKPGLVVASLPLSFRAVISAPGEDVEKKNNEMEFRVRAITQRRRLLLVDGRPRWETRYLRNLFERDQQWEVNALLAGTTANEATWPRGDGPGQFPGNAAMLATYDLVFFGEVPRALFSNEELGSIRDFVANRGGGIVFIDGQRGALKEYANTPLAELLPVEWNTTAARVRPGRLEPTAQGVMLASFTFESNPEKNSEVWTRLRPPHWVAPATALPGTETLVETVVGDQKVPAVVLRMFGAGKSLYCGFDESWRWRHEVGDLHHQRYWNQVAGWMAEATFAVKDKLVSLDAGAINYEPGETADLRVRLRDGQGRPVADTVVDAEVYREGIKVSTVRLAPDENAGGLFRGKTGALEEGDYEVGVAAVALAKSGTGGRASFQVRARESGESLELSANEDLLRQMASVSGGTFLREENVAKLRNLLEPLSQGRVVESDTVLWQSYWWFAPIILLLTVEWILRKRAGML